MAEKILLTGATGFLGSHILPKLIERKSQVIVLKRSFSNVERIRDILANVMSFDIDKVDIESVFKGHKIATVIHVATDYGKKSGDNMSRMIETNVGFPSQLLELGERYGAKSFINAGTSTGSEYTLYSATKNAFMEIGKFYSANRKINFVNMKIEYMYGEGDDSTKFLPFVIESIIADREIKATNGEQKRDFVYVKDVADAYGKVLDNLKNLKKRFVEFEIGSGKAVSLRECVEKIEDIIGRKADIKWGALQYRQNEVFYSQADIKRAKELLGWEPRFSLDEGLNNTIRWYREYYDCVESGLRT